MDSFSTPTPQLAEINVITPVYQALDRVKRILFQPFDLGKWFIIGFTAWLAQLGESGGGNFNFNTGGGSNRRGGGSLQNEFEQARDYVMSHLYWIIPVAVGVVILLLALWLVITWLNSRGRFMFLHCVALNKAEVAVPWRKFAKEGNSLFWFRIVLGLIATVVMLPLIALAVAIGVWAFGQGKVEVMGIMGIVGVALVILALALVFFLIAKLTKDFVVPIMFLRGCRCLESWRILRGLLTANLGNFALYLLFQIVLALATGILVIAVAVITCCVCCLLLVPYLGTVILLPVFTFHRAYSAHYLAQYGPAFDVFATKQPAPQA